MKILVDTREQKPLEFKKGKIFEGVVRTALEVGDYAGQYNGKGDCCVLGRETNFRTHSHFERKTIPDLFGTLTRDHARFSREIGRAREANIKLVIAVEGTLDQVLRGTRYSRVPGSAILRQLHTLKIKYGVEHLFFSSRAEMAYYIREYFEALGRLYAGKRVLC